MDGNDENDTDPVDLMGKYNGGGKKKGKQGHRHRYRNDDNIKALHGLYKEPKDNDYGVCGDDDENGDWDDMEEKQREESTTTTMT